MRGTLRSEIQIIARGLDSAGTEVGGYILGGFSSCGGLCNWGSSAPFSLDGGFTVGPGPIARGEWLDESWMLYESSFGSTTTPSSFTWSAMRIGPEFRGVIGADELSLWGRRPDGSSTQVDIALALLRSTAIVNASIDVELDRAPLTLECVASPNSSGHHSFLQAFGSLEAGQEWLTLRSQNVPPNQLAVLLTGTALVTSPAANYTLCIGGAVRRQGGNQISSAAGELFFDIDLICRLPGQTLYLQVLHRDPVQGVQASNCISVVVQ